MKTHNYLFITIVILITLSCQKEPPPTSPNQIVQDGVIVWQRPIWKVPHDTTNYVTVIVDPYWQFDDKVIVDTYKNKKAGIRCMEIETGKVIWEQYFEGPSRPQGLNEMNILDHYFNPKDGYLIFSIGNWGETEHIKLNIHTGEVLWQIPLETFISIEPYGNHYYCTVLSSGNVHPIYRVDIETGQAEFFYETDLPPHPDYNAQRNNGALPFMYNGEEMLIIDQIQMTTPNSSNHYFCLMNGATGERILKHNPIGCSITKVEVKDGVIYLFTGEGYKIFNMETLAIEREVKLIDQGQYMYHTFYKDKLIVGLTATNGVDKNGHYIVDLNTHSLLYIFEDWVFPSAILDDVLYFVSTGKTLHAYNLSTGNRLINSDLRYNSQFGVATYKNAEGKKFVVTGDLGYTYCFEAI
ncbi:MAG: PQQ-binding-like beta-propeller repeat protein [Bacteroidales bacterium]|nr:PQQ-binding-like beta-propeller repeat protein [Tenuifilaceae bacterium]